MYQLPRSHTSSAYSPPRNSKVKAKNKSQSLISTTRDPSTIGRVERLIWTYECGDPMQGGAPMMMTKQKHSQ
ncbi:unnamed protein product [Ceratitis capitata]|uniref:(Mediterranean fruit fly) hypothetical protein n=1 Tax=Ceratitis capitata TaxID=7213 RepID=A0A811TYJ3_CERCA|nr:unnamed protein product [Ceratitis capitata]